MLKHRLTLVALVVAAALATVAAATAAPGPNGPGAVYTLTNSPAGNAVLVYDRSADGTLTAEAPVWTSGVGTGAGLGSQGALVLSDNGKWLLAVNAGSNTVSLFRVEHDGLTLADTAPSGGIRPVSVTVSGDTAYVLNQGGSGSNLRVHAPQGLARADRRLDAAAQLGGGERGTGAVLAGRPPARRHREGDEPDLRLHRRQGRARGRAGRLALRRLDAVRLRLRQEGPPDLVRGRAAPLRRTTSPRRARP